MRGLLGSEESFDRAEKFLWLIEHDEMAAIVDAFQRNILRLGIAGRYKPLRSHPPETRHFCRSGRAS